MLSIFFNLVHDSVEIYMDNFTPYGDDLQEALSNLSKVLQRCGEMNLSLSHEKCLFQINEGIVLGHYLCSKGIQVDSSKIAIIKNVLVPQKQRDVRSLLGLVGYYWRFIKDFSKITSPLFSMLTKDVEFCWTNPCQEAFESIKEKLMTTPILRGPNWTLPFHIHTDASDREIGATLGQFEGKLPYAIYFISKNLFKAESNFTLIEK